VKNVETEVKIHVGDLAPIEQWLKSYDAKLTAERVYERNVRYEDGFNSFSPSHRVLRLRQDSRARLTYKEPGSGAREGITSRTELEVEVSDFDTAHLILAKLGFHAAWVYEKYRTTYELDGCEVVLDEMPFGGFIEIEGEPDAIERVLSTLELAGMPRITESYSDLFFHVKAKMGLNFEDLTFENFKDITVPDKYFSANWAE
jgi:adenylate cyclase, class 2